MFESVLFMDSTTAIRGMNPKWRGNERSLKSSLRQLHILEISQNDHSSMLKPFPF